MLDTAACLTESASRMSDNAPSTAHITQLLIAWSDGNRDAIEDLLPLVYEELRRLASRYLRHEASGHTLQPTALVHEAHAPDRSAAGDGATRIFGIAAQIMRRILVDHARMAPKAAPTGSIFLSSRSDCRQAPTTWTS